MTPRSNLFDIPRAIAWGGFFALILVAWWYLYAMATGMGLTVWGGRAAAPVDMGAMANGGGMSMAMTAPGVLVAMWMVMMAAMMGPTFVPTARTYEDLIRSGAGTRAGFVGLVAGYLGAWFVAGAGIGLLHAGLLRLDLLGMTGASTSTLLSAGLLAAAGLYQFTPLKDRCADHCRSPMTHFLAHWHPGVVGGVRMGLRHGLFCIGCCVGIMVLGFVGGAMNLAWMGAATLIMTLEKLPDLGRWLTRPLGAAFLTGAAWQLTTLI